MHVIVLPEFMSLSDEADTLPCPTPDPFTRNLLKSLAMMSYHPASTPQPYTSQKYFHPAEYCFPSYQVSTNLSNRCPISSPSIIVAHFHQTPNHHHALPRSLQDLSSTTTTPTIIPTCARRRNARTPRQRQRIRRSKSQPLRRPVRRVQFKEQKNHA